MHLLIYAGVGFALLIGVLIALKEILGIRLIPNDKIGVVEKIWSGKGSVKEGHIIAMNSEAGLQADIIRGGLHFGLQRWQYHVHKCPMVTVPQGKIAYIYARDGQPLQPSQTLGRVIDSNNFQDARIFLGDGTPNKLVGQRGRQRAILREGVYAINLGLFIVMAEDRVYNLNPDRNEANMLSAWQKELKDVGGFMPVKIGTQDDIGVVTIQDGDSLPTGEIIAPAIDGHNNYQDPEKFLANGGRRGRQYNVLTDGTYFINRWFATVELKPKVLVEIGNVGVVISYVGKKGADVSGDKFRHGTQVAEGEKGVWAEPFGPGKYAFNMYAGQIVGVPTTNFVLHWIDGKSESHRFDDNLRSIDLVTRDAYEPVLPLSLVVHIDYQKAPNVIQRFGDVKKLITQTIDPMLSAYFRDVCHRKSMLELLQDRDTIQKEAREHLQSRFEQFDIECVDVLIGKPEAGKNDGGKIETLLEQLRQRQLSVEQVSTFQQQKVAADKQRELTEAQATAAKQAELTNSSIQIRIAENAGNAELAKAEMKKKQTIVEAEATLEQSRRRAETVVINAKAEAEQTVLAATAESQSQILRGKGEGTKVLQVGLAEATALERKVAAYGDPKYYALIQATESIAHSAQPLVPERVFTTGGSDGKSGESALNLLLNIFTASGTSFQPKAASAELQSMIEKMTGDAMGGLGMASVGTDAPQPVNVKAVPKT